MKRGLLALTILTTMAVQAQVLDSTIMGSGYANDVYYSLGTGTVKTEPKNNWHLAFPTSLFNVSVLINESNKVELYEASTDTADWATLDTTGMAWNPMHNHMATFDIGAFNRNATGHPNYGWGVYGPTHDVVGVALYVLKYGSTYKKVFIKSMLNTGEVNFKIANLDGTGELKKTFSKTTYSSKHFVYFDIENDMFRDREPAKADWDLLWTQYFDETIPYYVSGIKLNPAVTAVRAENVDTATVNHGNYTSVDSTCVIGSSWKSFSFGPPSGFEVDDSLAVFIDAQDGNRYKMLFKGFTSGLSSNGKTTFTYQTVSGIGLEELDMNTISVYPNPATSFITIEIEENATAEIINMTGAVLNTAVLTAGANRVDISNLARGIYMLKVNAQGKTGVTKVVVQ